MDLLTEPVSAQPRRATDTLSSTDWLDAFATGACDQETFLRGVGDMLQRAPDAGWELLALVDQYYRRGKIDAEAFVSLKGHLQNLLLGGSEVSIPLHHSRTQRLADPATAPTPGLLSEPVDPPRSSSQDSVPVTSRASPRAAQPAPRPTQTLSTPSETANPPARSSTLQASVPVVPRTAPPSAGPARRPASNPLPESFYQPGAAAARPSMPAGPVRRPTPTASQVPPSEPVYRHEPVADNEPPQPQTARAPAIGDVLRGRYRVVAMLGQGGMGTVYEAVDQYRLDRSHGDQKVALKVLHTAVIQRPRLFAELRREFQHLQSLSHPNIVRVHEFDRDGDLAFFTMEYLSGVLLARVLSANVSASLYRPYALSMIRDVGAAVAHAHARGVVHGDLNPGNVFITDAGDIRVLDFGAAHQLRRQPWISEFESSEQLAVATPSYASCQLLEGETADARDDVYALACIAYVLLTGDHPFGDNSALKARTLRQKPRRPAALTRRQWNALQAGLHFERDRRPADMQAWLTELKSDSAAAHLPALETLLTVRPARQGNTRWMAVAAALLLIAAGAWWIAANVDSLTDPSAGLVTKFKATFANTMLGQLWQNDHESVADAGAVVPPNDATAPATTAAVAPAAPLPASGHSVPLVKTPPGSTRNGPRPLPDATTATNGAAVPSGAATAGTTARVTSGAATTAPPGAWATGGVAATGTTTGGTSANGAPATGSLSAAIPPTVATQVPGTAPIHARIELAADNIDVTPEEAMAHVLVRRTRTLRGDVSFSWWTESGTAKPGRDFAPVKSQVEHIEDGKNAANLSIPILADPGRHDPRSFYIVIDEASDNATLGQRTLTMVTIPGTE